MRTFTTKIEEDPNYVCHKVVTSYTEGTEVHQSLPLIVVTYFEDDQYYAAFVSDLAPGTERMYNYGATRGEAVHNLVEFFHQEFEHLLDTDNKLSKCARAKRDRLVALFDGEA